MLDECVRVCACVCACSSCTYVDCSQITPLEPERNGAQWSKEGSRGAEEREWGSGKGIMSKQQQILMTIKSSRHLHKTKINKFQTQTDSVNRRSTG